MSWSQLRAAGKSPLLPLLPSCTFTDVMTNLKLAPVVASTPWKSANAINLDSYFSSKMWMLNLYSCTSGNKRGKKGPDVNVIESGKPKSPSLRTPAHASYSPTLVKCCVFLLYFGFCLAESLLPVEPLGPPSNETERRGKWWGMCFNVISLKTLTNKKFSVHIAA